jgi:hypothetical protein
LETSSQKAREALYRFLVGSVSSQWTVKAAEQKNVKYQKGERKGVVALLLCGFVEYGVNI